MAFQRFHSTQKHGIPPNFPGGLSGLIPTTSGKYEGIISSIASLCDLSLLIASARCAVLTELHDVIMRL
jgi:hypothetical protein